MPVVTSPKCPACGSFFRAEDLDAGRGILTCSYCRALMLVDAPHASAEALRARAEVALPARFTVEDTARGLEIRRRWFRPVVLFLAFFCVVWFAFLFVWFAAVLSNPLTAILALVPIVHVVFGVVLAYATLAGFLNTTTIRVDDDEITVSHAPIPWPGKRRVARASIDQLFCKERIDQRKRGASTSYEVWTSMRDGAPRKLVTGLEQAEQALFVEQRIEKALGLSDRSMPQELPR